MLSFSLTKLLFLYFQLCDEHPDILINNVWATIGFTYDATEKSYYLIKVDDNRELCLACTRQLEPKINAFCYRCKSPRPLDWTTGNKSLNSFIMESWNNMRNACDAYIQWIEYTLLTDIQEMKSLCHECTHIADWLELRSNESTRVTLKRMDDAQSFDFYQVNCFAYK